MGILSDYLADDAIDDEPIEYSNEKPKDGTYEFEIGDAHIQHWEKKGVEHDSFVIDYYLTDQDGNTAPKTSDFITLPEPDKDPEDYSWQEKNAVRTLRDRMLACGIPKERIASADRDDLVGVSGVLTLKTNNKGYQNITTFTVDDAGVAPEEDEPAPAPKTVRRAAAAEAEPEFPARPSRRRS